LEVKEVHLKAMTCSEAFSQARLRPLIKNGKAWRIGWASITVTIDSGMVKTCLAMEVLGPVGIERATTIETKSKLLTHMVLTMAVEDTISRAILVQSMLLFRLGHLKISQVEEAEERLSRRSQEGTFMP
jgi:hypothetical protein